MKKSLKFLAIALSIGLMAFATKENPKTFTVVIDAGHGGKDHGVALNSSTEKEITKRVSDQLSKLNSDKDVVLHFTRTEDDFVSLQDRTQKINSLNPDLVLSIHVSANPNTTASGMEFYVSKDNVHAEKSRSYAEKIEQKFTGIKFKSRGIKEAPFYILKKSEAPAVLVELGFLSNPTDHKYLTDKAEQDKIAETILAFIQENK